MNTHFQKLNSLLNHGCPKGYKPVEKNYENKFLFFYVALINCSEQRLQMLNIGIKKTIRQMYSRSEFELG